MATNSIINDHHFFTFSSSHVLVEVSGGYNRLGVQITPKVNEDKIRSAKDGCRK